MELIECLEIIKETKKNSKDLVSFINEYLEILKTNKGIVDFKRYSEETEYDFIVKKLENGYRIVYGQYFGVTTTVEVKGCIINGEILYSALLKDKIDDSHVLEGEDLNVLIYNTTTHDGLVHKDYYFIKDNKLEKEDLTFEEMCIENFDFQDNQNNVLRIKSNTYTSA